MPRSAANLWSTLLRTWLGAGIAPSDPRLAADARMTATVMPRVLSPLVGAWLH